VLEGKDDDPCSILYIHFFQDTGAVAFDCTFADEELLAYFLGGMLPAYQLDDLSFPFRKQVGRLLFLGLELAFYDEGCQPGGSVFAVKDIAFVDGEDGFLYLFFIGILQEIAFGAGFQHLHDEVFLFEHGQGDDLKIRILKKDDDSPGYKKKKVMSLMANIMVKNANPGKNKPVRIVSVSHPRDVYRSIFNFIWKSIFEGVQKTVGIDGKLG